MHTTESQTIYLKDYQPPAFLIDRVDLRFDIGEEYTEVSARMGLSRNPAVAPVAALTLVGQNLTLVDLKIDGRFLAPAAYQITPEQLVIDEVPDSFFCDITVRIDPAHNTTLMGLYRSGENYYTQCEAEGFRRMMYYLDRPDVLARFSTTIVADKKKCPVLLSNGNLVGEGIAGRGRHWVKWVDPFRKPAYLFALVAGRLVKLEDQFTTRSGRQVKLEIWVEPNDRGKCQYAMHALQRAMRWDETRWGLEYDLDIYMVVAVSDFTMGAMENKGLNLFNTKYLLARSDTATDTDFAHIESVVGHEYFHNWTGNRVTCRDWFQLSLKEGLTVFRDQEFSMDQGSRTVNRIRQVEGLRTVQFPEDAGPMAHAVRPASYIEINNFYTATVYEKGAELIRMQHTLLGEAAFKAGLSLYLRRHDGQAATTDDFLNAMMEASGVDLNQFRRWYEQSGTPTLYVRDHYQPEQQHYTIWLTQHQVSMPEHPKLPLHIPVVMGLIDPEGNAYPLQLEGESAPGDTQRVLSITQETQAYTFIGIPHAPVPSLLRGFSAPVKLDYVYSPAQLAHLLRFDTDEFNRWDAGQQLAQLYLHQCMLSQDGLAAAEIDSALPHWIDAIRVLLADVRLDPAFVALTCTLPSEAWLAESVDPVNPETIHSAREALRVAMSRALFDDWKMHYHRLSSAAAQDNAAGAAARALRNTCLNYLTADGNLDTLQMAKHQFDTASNMTDALAALTALNASTHPYRAEALGAFEARWQNDPLVMDKWFALQATSPLPETLADVCKLCEHPAFTRTNPNKVYALIRNFAFNNLPRFHARDGNGYQFIADQVIALNAINPQVAARIAGAFNHWPRFEPNRRQQMHAALMRIANTEGLSSDVFEIVHKALRAGNTPSPEDRVNHV